MTTLAQKIDYSCLMEAVALRLLGHPQQKHGSEWRYNNNSLIVNVEMGTWANRQTNKRGGVPELVRLRRYDHAIWLRSQGLVDASGNPKPPQIVSQPAPPLDSQPEPPPPQLRAVDEPEPPQAVPEPEPVLEPSPDDIVDDTEADDAWAAPGWREAALEYHKSRGDRVSIVSPTLDHLAGLRKLIDDKVSLDHAARKLHGRGCGAAASTVEALVYGLRDGIDALPTKPERLRRLSELSEAQLLEVCKRLQNFKPNIAIAWTPEGVDALVELWRRTRGNG
jgi:hypothetical protein